MRKVSLILDVIVLVFFVIMTPVDISRAIHSPSTFHVFWVFFDLYMIIHLAWCRRNERSR